MAKLEVLVDGQPLPEDQAKVLWQRFSDHMGKHPGDLAGFAKAEGYRSAHPEHQGGRAVLVLSKEREQKPYGSR